MSLVTRMRYSVQQLLSKLFHGRSDFGTGTSTAAGHVTRFNDTLTEDGINSTEGFETFTFALACFAVHNTGGQSVDLEIWCHPDSSVAFNPATGADWFPVEPMDDGAGNMVPITIAAGGRTLLRFLSYTSNYRVVVKDNSGASTYSVYYQLTS